MTRRRRAKGEGSIKHRTDGRYEGRVPVIKPDGTPGIKFIYGKTEAAVVQEKNRLLGRKAVGHLIATSTPTVKRLLADWEADAWHEYAANTVDRFRRDVEVFLLPAFGSLRVERLTVHKLQVWIRGHRRPDGTVPSIIATAFDTLRTALTYAVEQQWVPVNVATTVTITRPPRKPIRPLTMAEVNRFLAAIMGHRLYALFLVALSTGLRQGELLGLRWQDVDLTLGKIKVRQQIQFYRGKKSRQGTRPRWWVQGLKTERSRRTLTLPTFCVEALVTHRARQLEERLKAGPAHCVDHDFVFTTYTVIRNRWGASTIGSPLNCRSVLALWHLLLTRAGLDVRSFHAARHSVASLLIQHKGTKLEQISMLLGHSRVEITVDTYGHLVEQISAEAAWTWRR